MNQITDYSVFDVPPYLLEQFRQSNLRTALNGINAQSGEFETAAWGFFAGMWIATGVGAQLDAIGVHLGLSRDGRSDVEYRYMLQLKTQINAGGGTMEAVIGTIRTLYDTQDFVVTSVPNATIMVLFGLASPAYITDAERSLLELVLPAGVQFTNGYYLIDDEDDYIVTDTDDYIVVSY